MKKKIREQGKQRQGSTRSRVSRSSTGEAFENQAEEGVLSRAPRARGWGDGAPARRHSKDSGLGSRRKEEAGEGRREPGRRVGKDPSGAARRTLPGPPRDTQMFRAGFRSRAGREPLKARRGCGLNQPGPAIPLAPFRVQTRLSSTWRPRRDHALTRGHQQRTHGASHEHRSREHSGPRESPRSHRRVPAPSSPRLPRPGPGRW